MNTSVPIHSHIHSPHTPIHSCIHIHSCTHMHTSVPLSYALFTRKYAHALMHYIRPTCTHAPIYSSTHSHMHLLAQAVTRTCSYHHRTTTHPPPHAHHLHKQNHRIFKFKTRKIRPQPCPCTRTTCTPHARYLRALTPPKHPHTTHPSLIHYPTTLISLPHPPT